MFARRITLTLTQGHNCLKLDNVLTCILITTDTQGLPVRRSYLFTQCWLVIMLIQFSGIKMMFHLVL